jgi:hypothetical protein
MKTTKLVNDLLNLRENYEYLQDMNIILSKDRQKVTINLEYTMYDYDFIPAPLREVVENYFYEWNYSYEFTIYLGIDK